MKRLIRLLLVIVGVSVAISCSDKSEVKIAFLADVHLHDIYATLSDVEFENAPVDSDNHKLLLRPMAEQMRSTRVYNENYFAFMAAMDDIVKRGVDYVILPGDFSDDGQINNILALRNILSSYSQEFGIEFFITTGNHDPVRPFTRSDVGINFLDSDGGKQRFSGVSKSDGSLFSEDVRHLGYEGIVSNLSDFGFMPQPSYLYWESPYSSYDYNEYSYETALDDSNLSKREYTINDKGYTLPDASYLVEPVEGLWLLAIDANAYPLNEKFEGEPKNPLNYASPSNGYSVTLEHKKEILKWVEDVAQRAKSLNKKVVAFSHYPLVDFFDSAAMDVANALGEGRMQLNRNPTKEVADIFADAGIKLHFAGHMHIDDVGVHTSQSGNTLVNIQVPSLAGYSPGYKLMTMRGKECLIETITLDDVPGFNKLFPIYELEYNNLVESGAANVWSRDVLSVESYQEFLSYHIRELVRLRFIPSNWPSIVDEELLSKSGYELLMESGVTSTQDIVGKFMGFTTFDIIYDFYRLYGGGTIGVLDVGEQRLVEYEQMLKELSECSELTPVGRLFTAVFGIIDRFQEEGVSDRVVVELN